MRVLTWALALVCAPAAARAQAVYGLAEADDEDVTFFLLGASMSFGGLGWKPYAAIAGSTLHYPSGSGSTTRNAITPVVGIMHAQPTQSFRVGLGYTFADVDRDVSPILVGAESGDGVIGVVGWDNWGSGNRALQFLGSFNFGTSFLWTRGRAAARLGSTSPLFVGGEAALLGDTDASTTLAQFGPTLEYRFSPTFRLGAAAGLKAGLNNASGSAAYGRLEFLWLAPGGR